MKCLTVCTHGLCMYVNAMQELGVYLGSGV